MTIKIKHAKVSGVADSGNSNLVQPSDWNADLVSSMEAGKIVGRTSAGTGPMEEISVGSGLSLSSSTLAVDGTYVESVVAPMVEGIAEPEIISLAPSANQNNYATGIDGRKAIPSTLIITPTNSIKITGIDTTGWEVGKRVRIANGTVRNAAGARMILLESNSTSSAAGNTFNLFATGGFCIPVIMMPGDEIEIYFDGSAVNIVGGSRLGSPDNMFDWFTSGIHFYTYLGWWTGTNSNAWGNTYITFADDAFPAIGIETGTTSTGNAHVATHSVMFAGYGAMLSLAACEPGALSTSTNEYLLTLGFTNAATGTLSNMIGWVYDRPNDTVWRTRTMSNGVATTNSVPALTVSADDIIWLGTFVNGDGTNVEFFYSTDYGKTWTFVSTQHTANIPTGPANLFGCGFNLVKKTGTATAEGYLTMHGYRWQKNLI